MNILKNAGVAKDILRIVENVQAIQQRFLDQKGMTWEQVRAFGRTKQEKLQAEYSEWLKREA